MAEYTALAPLFTDIANAIRSKTGETGAITANSFPAMINQIELGMTNVSIQDNYLYETSTSDLPYSNYFSRISCEENTEILINCMFRTTFEGDKGTVIIYKCLPNFTMQYEEYTITTQLTSRKSLHVQISDSNGPNWSELCYLSILSFA